MNKRIVLPPSGSCFFEKYTDIYVLFSRDSDMVTLNTRDRRNDLLPGIYCLFHLLISVIFVGRGRVSFSYVPISRIDPRSLPRVVIDEVHLSVEVMGDIPTVRKRYLPIPSPGHISLRSKSIQNLSLSLSSCGRRAHICARGRTLLGPHIRHARTTTSVAT